LPSAASARVPGRPRAPEELGAARLCDGLDHPECVTVARDGAVFAGGERGQVYRVEDGEARVVVETGGSMLGVSVDGDGLLYACDVGHRCVWRIDPLDATAERLFAGTPSRPLTRPNFGCFGPDGTYYLSDSGDRGAANGCIWAVRPDGRAELWTDELGNFPNGLAVTADGRRLVAVETFPGALVEVAIEPRGGAGARRELARIPHAVPDGVALLADGGALVACYRPDAILRYRPGEGVEPLVADPHAFHLAAPTNAAFLAAGSGTLLVANFARRHLTTLELDVRGAPLHHPTRDRP
jgi:gluconolactonase